MKHNRADGGRSKGQVDTLVLTAANPAQARGYQKQLEAREEKGKLPDVLRTRVLSDPGGRRAGSGGSTLWVLYQLARELSRQLPGARDLGELFAGRRVLIVHSGGESRRLCAYAAQGKIFLPLPCDTRDGHPAALFDLVLEKLTALPAPERGQVLIASGDVLLTFDPGECRFALPGVTGVAYAGPIERGSRHGVYVAGRDGRVTDFLQKPDEATARQRHAVDSVGRVLVDTGLISLDPAAVARWLQAAGVTLKGGQVSFASGIISDLAAGRGGSLDLYEEILMALVPALDEAAYLDSVHVRRVTQVKAAGVRTRLSKLYRELHGQPFFVNVLSYCDFFHIGSTRELLAQVGTLNRTARAYSFTNLSRSAVAGHAATEGAFIYNSILSSSRINAGDGVLLESVESSQEIELPGRNVVVGCPAEARVALSLPEGWGLVCLPLQTECNPGKGPAGKRWVAVAFGVDDDFKTSLDRQGTFGNQRLAQFVSRNALTRASIWPGLKPERQTLWEARLWTPGAVDHCLRPAMKMARGEQMPPEWVDAPRLSMAQILPLVDHDRLLEHQARLQRLGELHQLKARLERDPWLPAAKVLELVRTREEASLAMRQVDELLQSSDTLAQARLGRLAHALNRGFKAVLPSRPQLKGTALERLAFDAVARAVERQAEIPTSARGAAILRDQVVWVTCPVRLDFAGGWSDTPPICAELGGAVVNAAVTLNRQYPIQVVAKLSQDPKITLTSLDLGRRVEIRETPSAAEYRDPRQWSALAKAALVLGGFCPADTNVKLRRWLDRMGGGLEITIFSAVPKGSGLGTSSILGAAMLACLARVVGEPLSPETLIARTSALEQFMTTAGGWQDQVGGTTPGVKLIRTQPGPEQTPMLHRTVFDLLPGGELRSRLLLYYTGYQRMAKNILQNVVGRYLDRDPEAIAIIRRLKEGAEQMKDDLAAGDVDAFGRGIELYWQLKKQLDPGSTNDKIEGVLQPIHNYLTGKTLAGAGGGGFIFMVARDAAAAGKIRKQLEQKPPNRMARFFDFDVDSRGLAVTVL